MFVKKEITFDDMGDFLWGPAQEKWLNATDGQREEIWDILESSFVDDIPEATTVNDAVAYDFNDVFFPEEYDESMRRKKLESRMNRIERLLKKYEKKS